MKKYKTLRKDIKNKRLTKYIYDMNLPGSNKTGLKINDLMKTTKTGTTFSVISISFFILSSATKGKVTPDQKTKKLNKKGNHS